jgi:MFS-type transporter involved in bile tolerance (Atg22 family)
MNIDLILILADVGIFVGGFILGKFHERYQWNKLIHMGILPKPY